MGDHKRIWLQNAADGDPDIGRMWCEDKVWPDVPEDGEPTEYVRADIAQELVTALTRAAVMLRLVTVRQVIEAGDEAIEAAGLNPWVMNEGLADGPESIGAWWAEAALAKARGE